MSSGVVFKVLKSKAVGDANTPSLNCSHLTYIATRKGAQLNEGCSFGLWGRLPGMVASEDIYDFGGAKRVTREVSQRHVMYRDVISVEGQDAIKHGLYDRATWQALINKKIGVIAQGRGIAPEDFCWMASMHHAKGHPHVHILSWDNSPRIHQLPMPPKRFEAFTSKVRAEFSREIYREEITEHQEEANQTRNTLQLEIKALCQDMNLYEVLNLNNVKTAKLDTLGRSFAEQALDMPARGRLDFKHLPPDYKGKLDAFLDEVMKISDFQKLQGKYIKLRDEISGLYGNSYHGREQQHGRARDTLQEAMRNGVLSALKDYKNQLVSAAPAELEKLRGVIEKTAQHLVRLSPGYASLLAAMPKERTPMHIIRKDPDFAAGRRQLLQELHGHLYVRTQITGYIKNGQEQAKLEGKNEKAELAQSVHKDATHILGKIIDDTLQHDAGYQEQAQADAVTRLLLNLFRSASQHTNQCQSQRDLINHRHRALSKTAQRNRMKQQEQDGDWSQEW